MAQRRWLLLSLVITAAGTLLGGCCGSFFIGRHFLHNAVYAYRDRLTGYVAKHEQDLRAEARQLIERATATGQSNFGLDDELPRVLQSLRPQSIAVDHRSDATIVNIQIEGGFSHWGYAILFATSDIPPPQSVQVTKFRQQWVVDGIIEYRESGFRK